MVSRCITHTHTWSYRTACFHTIRSVHRCIQICSTAPAAQPPPAAGSTGADDWLANDGTNYVTTNISIFPATECRPEHREYLQHDGNLCAGYGAAKNRSIDVVSVLDRNPKRTGSNRNTVAWRWRRLLSPGQATVRAHLRKGFSMFPCFGGS